MGTVIIKILKKARKKRKTSTTFYSLVLQRTNIFEILRFCEQKEQKANFLLFF